MSGPNGVSDFKRQVQASTQVPAWGKTNKPPPQQLAVPQSYGGGGSSPASSSIALPGQKKKKAKAVYHARTPEELLKEIHLRGRDGGGLSVKHLKEGFPAVNEHIEQLEAQGRVLVIRTDKNEPKQVFWNEITPEQGGKAVDDEFKSLWDQLKNPVEADLLKALEKEGLQPTASEAVAAKAAPKKKDKKSKAHNRNVKIQNTHITNIDLRKDFSADKKFGQS
ncbi:hypothetical protein FRB90_005253 [Tulasnella sp. 427]|nr:hypothetical protein FRB90_005253 [Tulasnella sp. 427]